MLIASIIALIPVVFFGVLYVKTQLRNRKRFAELLPKCDTPGHLSEDRLRHNIFSTWIYQRVFGLWFAAGTFMGNCFSPAIVLVWHGMSKKRSSHAPPNLEGKSERHRQLLQRGYERRLAEPHRWNRAAWATLTLRWKHAETRIYWRGWLFFDWNSEHIARRFGVFSDHSEHGGPCMVYTYRGWLGSHQYL